MATTIRHKMQAAEILSPVMFANAASDVRAGIAVCRVCSVAVAAAPRRCRGATGKPGG